MSSPTPDTLTCDISDAPVESDPVGVGHVLEVEQTTGNATTGNATSEILEVLRQQTSLLSKVLVQSEEKHDRGRHRSKRSSHKRKRSSSNSVSPDRYSNSQSNPKHKYPDVHPSASASTSGQAMAMSKRSNTAGTSSSLVQYTGNYRSRSPGQLSSNDSLNEFEQDISSVPSHIDSLEETNMFDHVDPLDHAEAELTTDGGTGAPIDEKLAEFVNNRFKKKIEPDLLRKKAKDYKRPTNCPYLGAPQTNPAVWKVIPNKFRASDCKLQNIHSNLAIATTAVTGAIAALYQLKKENPDINLPLQSLLDSVSFLGHTHQLVSDYRKNTQKYCLAHEVKPMCDTAITNSSYLYGDDSDLEKRLKELEKEELSSGLPHGQYRQSFQQHKNKGQQVHQGQHNNKQKQKAAGYRNDGQRYASPNTYKAVCQPNVDNSLILYGDNVQKTFKEVNNEEGDFGSRLTLAQTSFTRYKKPFSGPRQTYNHPKKDRHQGWYNPAEKYY